ncbi:MAG: glycoside hydrolase family 13 protein, partial [Clostridia bacterium]|nr:glycoside hydrolase family 13 protein [Clostridia bacterium]
TQEDFEQLVSEAKKRWIRLILDGVFNHTGDDSLYFNKYGHYNSVGAYQSTESPYIDWFLFYSYPNGYDSWWGINTLPAVNETSKSYQNFLFGADGVLKHWLHTGISDYRLDVADELPDFFLKKLRKAVKERDPEPMIIGEVWEDASNKVAYGERREYFQGEELDSVMNYPLKEAIIGYILDGNSEILLETVYMLIDNYPKCVLDSLMNILSTHDTCRILTVFGEKKAYNKEEMAVTFLDEEEKAVAVHRLKLAAVLQYTLPGVPCVYYGDENAMEGYIDPFCRRCFDWEHLNEDLIGFYQKLGTLRRDYREILKDGNFIEVYHENELLIFARYNDEGCCYVYINNSSKIYNLSLSGAFTELISGKTTENFLQITAYSYGILVKTR